MTDGTDHYVRGVKPTPGNYDRGPSILMALLLGGDPTSTTKDGKGDTKESTRRNETSIRY
jgi:hypothetical protein